MNVKKCTICGNKLIKHGKTKKGKQRGFCSKCKASNVVTNNNNFYQFKKFLDWLLSKNSQEDLKINDRTFRRHNENFGKYGALPEYVDEVFDVVFCDGLYLSRNIVILIACSRHHVLGGYLAKSENARSWSALLSKIAPPVMVVTDGGYGFRKALKQTGPSTCVQRCTFHVFQQVRRYTTLRPKLPAGQELLAIARMLLKVDTLEKRDLGKDAYIDGTVKGNDFLNEKSFNDEGKYTYTHERLRKARNTLNRILNDDSLFTYLNPMFDTKFRKYATNNIIEGRINSQLRAMLRNHRGLPVTKRAKACFGGCYLDTEYKLPMSLMLKNMITDDEIDEYYQAHNIYEQNNLSIERGGDGIVWNEFHSPTPYPFHYD